VEREGPGTELFPTPPRLVRETWGYAAARLKNRSRLRGAVLQGNGRTPVEITLFLKCPRGSWNVPMVVIPYVASRSSESERGRPTVSALKRDFAARKRFVPLQATDVR
jgi:hypothetical protein